MRKITSLRRAILGAEEGAVIYAQAPFSAESKAMRVKLDGDGYAPEGFEESAEGRGFSLFLDADTVNELLDVAHDVRINKEQLVDLVLYYAEFREYPSWFHDLEVKD